MSFFLHHLISRDKCTILLRMGQDRAGESRADKKDKTGQDRTDKEDWILQTTRTWQKRTDNYKTGQKTGQMTDDKDSTGHTVRTGQTMRTE